MVPYNMDLPDIPVKNNVAVDDRHIDVHPDNVFRIDLE